MAARGSADDCGAGPLSDGEILEGRDAVALGIEPHPTRDRTLERPLGAQLPVYRHDDARAAHLDPELVPGIQRQLQMFGSVDDPFTGAVGEPPQREVAVFGVVPRVKVLGGW